MTIQTQTLEVQSSLRHECAVVPLDQRDAAAIEQLLSTFAFYEYRYIRVFPANLLRRYVTDQILGALADSSAIVWGLWRGTTLTGLLHAVHLPWDTAHFGSRMYAIQHLITVGPPQQREALAELLVGALARQRGGEIDYLSHRVDTEDYPTIHALEAQGFRLGDTVINYLFATKAVRSVARRFRSRYHVRPMADTDRTQILTIAGQTNFKGRFYHDARIERRKADAMYLTWVERCCDGALADDVLVAERQGRVVGFITYRRFCELERLTGFKIAGRGLLSVLPTHAGAAIDLFRAALIRGGRIVDFGLFDVRLTNPSMLRLCGAFHMRIAHSTHVFYRWKDHEPPSLTTSS